MYSGGFIVKLYGTQKLKHRTIHIDHMHSAVHGSVAYGCRLVKKSTVLQKCINY